MKPKTTQKNPLENFNGLTAASLMRLNDEGGWSLNKVELLTIQKHFKSLKRAPRLAEIETLAQTWSEHCKHKTFSGPVEFTRKGRTVKINNLFKETIVKATKKLNKKWCLSVFKDNAGVVEFDKKWALCFKVETHNHPCAIEPYGGAETGVGGVIRDVLGVGLGAKPVLNTDNFCFAPLDCKCKLPAHALTPKQIMQGVVRGVRDYGNRMGIPTASGSIYFDNDYRLNPLVYVGTVGVMPKWAVDKKVNPDDLIVSAGGRTGRDGIHGATFSSASLDEETSTSAVQIGHALNEKKVLDALLAARDKKLYRAVTDCGAGGFSSAIGELGAECGAKVHLEKASLKTSDLSPWEIWLSESQERMVFAVPPKNLTKLKKVFDYYDCPIEVLGKFTDTKKLEVLHKGKHIIDLDMKFLHDGLPHISKKALWKDKKLKKSGAKKVFDTGKMLSKILAHQNVCSKSWVIRQYDHEVQAGTIVKPLQGVGSGGPQDATVILPHAATGNLKSVRGFAVTQGINPEIGKLDPYQMALACADEAMRNLVCVGADITKCAFLDNFCWASPDNTETMGALVLAAQGCYDAAMGFKVPFISGKDSFYNESKDLGDKSLPIPHTLLISAIAPVDDIRKSVTTDFKETDSSIYIIGTTEDDIVASIFSRINGVKIGKAPKVNIEKAFESYKILQNAISKGYILSAHDLSDGGLGVTLAEMAFTADIGVAVNLAQVPFKGKTKNDDIVLFSETPSRIVVEVSSDNEKEFLKMFKGQTVKRIGYTVPEKKLFVEGLKGKLIISESLTKLKNAWDNALENVLAGKKAK
ncbi:MAG TPA: phosphoribosylformylglycinamidine synthase subunit PurL [Elusimicrobiales bacterium]|nr:phosphoribosylformylglycinamidine synthase subunit PurL [Elusimicrobiales bacterium]